jgi:hypothetical protein
LYGGPILLTARLLPAFPDGYDAAGPFHRWRLHVRVSLLLLQLLLQLLQLLLCVGRLRAQLPTLLLLQLLLLQSFQHLCQES